MIMPAPDSPGVTYYTAVTVAKSDSNPNCSVQADNAIMDCEITGLAAGTNYTVLVSACIGWSEEDTCGEPLVVSIITDLPIGKYLFQ